MKQLFLLLCCLAFLSNRTELTAQAFMGFENLMTSQTCTSTTCNYVDPISASSAHDLPDVGGIPVNSPAGPGILDFKSSFRPTRTGASSTGLNDGDFFGYAGSATINNNVGAAPTEGSQAFIAEDTDGEVTMTFSGVDLSGVTAATFMMDYIVDGGFESSDGADDMLKISLNVTGCPAAATVDLLNATGSGSAGSTDLNTITDQVWQSINQDLTPYLFSTCKVQLIIKMDLNSSTEEFALDNISFTAGIVVPVELVAFTARQQKEEVLLKWATAQETTNRGFSVERSMDGSSFAEIGWVNGAGESTSEEEYAFKDTDVVPGNVYYYRLRQEDFDGAFAFSEVVYVAVTGQSQSANTARFSPNPTAMGESQIELNVAAESDWVVMIYDAAGRQVAEARRRLVAGLNRVEIDLANEKSGAYLVRLVGPEEIIVRRVVRQ